MNVRYHSFMLALTSYLLTALLLFQAVSGWCCHRPCEVASSTCAVELETAVSSDCCHECSEAPASPANQSQPCECNECLGVCTFVSEKSLEVDVNPLSTLFAVLTLHASLPATTEVVVRTLDLQFENAQALPVRLHLLHRHILV